MNQKREQKMKQQKTEAPPADLPGTPDIRDEPSTASTEDNTRAVLSNENEEEKPAKKEKPKDSPKSKEDKK